LNGWGKKIADREKPESSVGQWWGKSGEKKEIKFIM